MLIDMPKCRVAHFFFQGYLPLAGTMMRQFRRTKKTLAQDVPEDADVLPYSLGPCLLKVTTGGTSTHRKGRQQRTCRTRGAACPRERYILREHTAPLRTMHGAFAMST